MTDLDPRLNAFRDDLADQRLKGRVAAPRYAEGRLAGIVRGVADLRRAPDAGSALDTQLLYGEAVTVFDEAEGWAWVQSRTDGYVGYIPSAALGEAGPAPTHRLRALRSYLFPAPDLKAPPLDCLSIASPLCVVGSERGYSALAGGGWLYSKHLQPIEETSPDIAATALEFLGTPYYWGGRSSIGLDCAALVQLCLACAGAAVLRDSYMQAASAGTALDWKPGETALQRGDLLYFPGHVAIVVEGTQVVHANAFSMSVAVEDLATLEARVRAESGGTGITGLRRVAL